MAGCWPRLSAAYLCASGMPVYCLPTPACYASSSLCLTAVSLPVCLPATAPAASRSLGECFQLFDVIHRITTSHATLTRITREVLEDFAADNVVYAELRTTPKASAARPLHAPPACCPVPPAVSPVTGSSLVARWLPAPAQLPASCFPLPPPLHPISPPPLPRHARSAGAARARHDQGVLLGCSVQRHLGLLHL